MKKIPKNQITLIGAVEDLIHSNLLKKILYQERVPLSTDDINFGKWEFNDSNKNFKMQVPIQRNASLSEKETLLLVGSEIGLTTQPLDNLTIHTTKDEFLNLLLFIIRKSRHS